MARPSKCTPEITESICQAVQQGATYEIAAAQAGIAVSTLHAWKSRALKALEHGKKKKSDLPYIEFLEAIKKADAKGALLLLATVRQAAPKDWKAAAWLLERRWKYEKGQSFHVEQAEETQEQGSIEPKLILMRQYNELIAASKQAFAEKSFQAFAALQSRIIQVALELRSIQIQDGDGVADNASDSEVIEQLTGMLLSLPPVLKQQILKKVS